MVLFWVLLRTFESYVLSKICFIFTPKLGDDFPIVASMLILNGWQNCFLYGYWIPMPYSMIKIVVQMMVWMFLFDSIFSGFLPIFDPPGQCAGAWPCVLISGSR